MSSPFKNVTVVGGSGNVGKHAVESLLKEGFTVSVLSRESSSYSPPEGVKLIKTDYSHSSLLEALRGQDVVVSVVALNEDALKLQIPIIDAAIEAGVRRFIPSFMEASSG
ncbi:hypothetical protein KEM55_008203 [Ascosphaera atra]|nr:hypothetical protein KEM55_008203 [Ascosphaera atra]